MSGFHPDYYLGRKGRNAAELDLYAASRLVGQYLLEIYETCGSNLSHFRMRLADDRSIVRLREIRDSIREPRLKNIFMELCESKGAVYAALRMEMFRVDPAARVYRVPKTFCEAILSVPVELQRDLIPAPFTAYFDFPKPVMFDSQKDPIAGMYVSVEEVQEGSSWENSSSPVVYKGDVIMTYVSISAARRRETNPLEEFISKNVSAVELIKDGKIVDRVTSTAAVKVLEELLKPSGNKVHATFSDPETRSVKLNIGCGPDEPAFVTPTKRLRTEDQEELRTLHLLANLVMYIHSNEPNVDHLKPASETNSKERRKLYENGINLIDSAFPVSLVSWNHGGDREYQMDSTTVRSHYRWQRCGEGLSKTKLVLIDEHERNFNKGEV
jgi:hypothetical protein